MVVVEAALERADHRRVHTELIPIVIDIGLRRLPGAAAAVRTLASNLLQMHAARVLAAADAHSRAGFAAVAAQYQEVAAAAARREQEISGAMPSAARRLVQVGLFDSRAAKALAVRRRAASLELLSADERLKNLAPGATLTTTLRIIAVRFGGGLVR